MSLNDDDKKFIKQTMQDALNNAEKASQKKSAEKEKADELKQQKQRKQDREELIKELQEKQNRGTATLSEQVELLKQTISSNIPDGVKQGGRIVSSGASQFGSGLSTINRKIMMSNPLTAMLYQNRDVFTAMGNMGIGAGKIAFGGLQMAGSGVANMLKALKEKNKSKTTSTSTSTAKRPRTNFLGIETSSKEESEPEKLLDSKSDISKKLDDIYAKVVLLSSKETPNQKLLKQGFSGITDVLNQVNFITGIIKKKVALGVTTFALAGLTLAAIAAYFMNGDFRDMVNELAEKTVGKVITWITENLPKILHNWWTNKADADRLKQQIKKEKDTGGEYTVKEGEQFNSNTPTSALSGEEVRNYYKNKNLTTMTQLSEKDGYDTWKGVTKTITSDNIGELSPVLCPFNAQVKDIKGEIKGSGADRQRVYNITIKASHTQDTWIFKGLIDPQAHTARSGSAWTTGAVKSGVKVMSGPVTTMSKRWKGESIEQLANLGKIPKGYLLGFASKWFSIEVSGGIGTKNSAYTQMGGAAGYEKYLKDSSANNYGEAFDILAEHKTVNSASDMVEDLLQIDDARRGVNKVTSKLGTKKNTASENRAKLAMVGKSINDIEEHPQNPTADINSIVDSQSQNEKKAVEQSQQLNKKEEPKQQSNANTQSEGRVFNMANGTNILGGSEKNSGPIKTTNTLSVNALQQASPDGTVNLNTPAT